VSALTLTQTLPVRAGSQTEGHRITRQFVEEMVEAFREQKKIHPRYAFEIVMGVLAVLKSQPTLVDVDILEGVRGASCVQAGSRRHASAS